MRMSERPPPTPEGRALKAALTKSGLSAREAARRANISEGRWRQIVDGYLTIRAGVYAEVKDAPADTVARMAKVVGVPPEAMEEAHRPDVAEIMRRELQAAKDQPAPDSSDPLEGYVAKTPVEQVLLNVLRADRRARQAAEEELQRQLRELNDKIDRLSSSRETAKSDDDGQSGERQLGA